MRWFERHLPATGVRVRPCATEYVGLSVAGPRARALLQGLVRDEFIKMPRSRSCRSSRSMSA